MANEPALRILSLGAGVQSTALALMAAHGEIGPMPDCAIFADTQSEPIAVYTHLSWLSSVLPFPIHTVTAGSLKADLAQSKRFASIPFFLDRGADGTGMARRQCTKEYKLTPLARKQRDLLGFMPKQRIPSGSSEVWIGISTDEAGRMKPSRNAWQTNRWPLIEVNLSRADCLGWLERHGYQRPVKSACTFCPYRSDESWLVLKETDPAGWEEAVAVDASLRDRAHASLSRATPYVHRSLKPLDEVDLLSWSERGQNDLFGEECEGMCGV